jgi:hypothetical protein
MDKRIVSAVLTIISTVMMVVGCALWCSKVVPITDYGWLRFLFMALFLIVAVVGIASTVLQVITVLKKKNWAYELCLISFACAISIFIVDMFFTIKYWVSAINIVINLVGILSLVCNLFASIYTPKQSHAFLGTLFAFVPFLILTIFSISANILGIMSAGYLVGFIAFGFLAILLSYIGAMRTVKGKIYGFELNISALLFEALMFIILCTYMASLSSLVYVLLSFCGVAVVAAGGILISQQIEFGFTITAFGLIFLVVWIGMIWITFSAILALTAVVMAITILIFMANAVRAHELQNEKQS